MTRYALLLALSLLVASCAAKATPTPAQANSRGVQATPELGQPASQSTPETRHIATHDAVTIRAIELAELQLASTLDESRRQDQIATETKSVGLTQTFYTGQTQTKQPASDAGTKVAQDAIGTQAAANSTARADMWTATYIAPVNQSTAAALAASAKYADMSAWMFPVSFFVFAIASIILALCVAYAVTRKGIERVATAIKDGSYFTRPWVPVSAVSHTTKPLPAEIEYMHQFIEYAITGLPLGENSMVKAGAWKSGEVWRKKRQLIMTYLDVDCGHIKDHKLTPQGIDFWRDWLDEQSPAPTEYMPENSENDGIEAHEHVNNDHVNGGGVELHEETAQNSE